METWTAHHLFQKAKGQHGADVAASMRSYAQNLLLAKMPVVFSLGHLAKITGVEYKSLRETVERRREVANYRMYAVAKRAGGRRFIHVVSRDLYRVQEFINQEILQRVVQHPCSFAFHCGGGIRECAAMHCGARWIFQYDLKDFFYDVTEIDVYRVFCGLGYRKLLAFEIARLCTTTHLPRGILAAVNRRHRCVVPDIDASMDQRMPYYEQGCVGVLPQGAPSSPMLSNLAARELDECLFRLSCDRGFVYTRYADDITISASDDCSARARCEIHREIVHNIRKARFRENSKKSRIAGPGSRKVVLGLLVDGDAPRISKRMFQRIDRHLHAAEKFGVNETASHEGFDSAYGFYNHLAGLVRYVHDVDPRSWKTFAERLARVAVPWEIPQ